MQNKTVQRDTLPENFDSIQEFWAFWDTHSSADYEDVMETVETEINLSSSEMYRATSKSLLSRESDTTLLTM